MAEWMEFGDGVLCCSHCGEWRENGICFACRQNAWIKGRKHRKSLIEEA